MSHLLCSKLRFTLSPVPTYVVRQSLVGRTWNYVFINMLAHQDALSRDSLLPLLCIGLWTQIASFLGNSLRCPTKPFRPGWGIGCACLTCTRPCGFNPQHHQKKKKCIDATLKGRGPGETTPASAAVVSITLDSFFCESKSPIEVFRNHRVHLFEVRTLAICSVFSMCCCQYCLNSRAFSWPHTETPCLLAATPHFHPPQPLAITGFACS